MSVFHFQTFPFNLLSQILFMLIHYSILKFKFLIHLYNIFIISFHLIFTLIYENINPQFSLAYINN